MAVGYAKERFPSSDRGRGGEAGEADMNGAPPTWADADRERAARAIRRAEDWLIARRRPDGHWLAELEGDTILESEWVLLKAFLGELDEPRVVKACRYIRNRQRPEGGWAIYPGGPFELSASLKAYWCLKMAGVPIDEPDMVRARELILEAGGVWAVNSFTRFYLALLGQIPYDDVPSVPPELVAVPSWLPFSLAEMSSWTRTMVVPLAIVSTLQPRRELPERMSIKELFRPGEETPPSRWTRPRLSWSNFFLCVDKALKVYHRFATKWARNWAVRDCHRWMLDHFENSDGLGAIYPPMVYTLFVFEALGYDRKSPIYEWAVRQLDDLAIEEGETLRFQPCLSPVWDTAIATIALADGGNPSNADRLRETARWLLSREIRRPGDWARRRRFRKIEPSGWVFEYMNDHYADLDDTAMVVMAMHRAGLGDEPAAKAATIRAVNWLLALQGRDGGWAAFDADIDNRVLTKVPFADHNAMLDPSCADITARVLEMLGSLGYSAEHPAAARALEFLWRTQEPEGCWEGRWGVNYVYGTWQVLQGMRAIGVPMDHPRLRKAADWLESTQQSDGGWGESCMSYEDRAWMGRGEPTPSQTAWAVLGLVAAGRADGAAARRGIAWLLDRQRPEGDWEEQTYTGTGFPKVFYLKYHHYRVYFPLMALARHRDAASRL